MKHVHQRDNQQAICDICLKMKRDYFTHNGKVICKECQAECDKLMKEVDLK